ncbi:hypothetical protein [Allorhizobium taibaishanense]|uniref:DUF4123 domain-containing protein n=1 Tax=Allorhizobium taibaishanense TaxID=887144 RepID=A0A1Q9AC16_9HYPH|nr:hypothetical protein [Allorhizobium taibaishanense]MBB4010686.1 hypothetical protein [Allorhizobium taibaishanense]OLP52431.1 hypothetical protein BJF91_00045 [Allorhizobium taibaishanense]
MVNNMQLKPLLLQARHSLFAVVDGGQFDDLPMALFNGNFVHRPLYLDRGVGSADQIRTAPQLVWLDRSTDGGDDPDAADENLVNERVLDDLLALLNDRPAAIFWQCSDGGDVLYRHLRGINKVLYPKPAYLDRDVQIPESGFEMVTFRHADANVIAQMSSALDWNGLSRLLGPAENLLFAPEDDWSSRPMRVRRHEEMAPPYTGPLRIGRNEINAMAAVRFEWLTRRTMNYLNEYAAERAQATPEATLNTNVGTWLREAQATGITEESAFRKWCYLQLLFEGKLNQSQFAQDFRKQNNTGMSADERVHLMMKYMIQKAEAA